MDNPSIRRILVMGCSRSGTTLLQSLLASHSRIHTFPETGVFLKALGMRGAVLPWVHLGLTSGKERKALARLLESQTQASGSLPPLPPRSLFLSRSLENVAVFLDGLAKAHGKDVWVEKTPRHVFHAERIGRMVKGVQCIHLVRKGEDVVASIVDRARKYPKRFHRQADPAYGIRQWNQSLRATEAAMNRPGHALVFYEKLAGETEHTLRSLCRGLGLEFETGMLSPANPSTFVSPDEGWKARKAESVEPAPSKFDGLFDDEARAAILRRLQTGILRRLNERASEGGGGVLFS
jgi:hypothetical protein